MLLGGFPALCCLTVALGTPQWTPTVQVPLAMVVWCAVGTVIVRRRRHLPPGLDLQWIGQAEAQRLRAAGPPPDGTLLHIRFEPDLGHRYRLDVLVDGQRVAQLPPGAACLFPLRAGEHQVGVYLDRPASMVTELVNAIPGVSTGYRVRNRDSRLIELEMRPEASLPANVRLVRPAAAGT